MWISFVDHAFSPDPADKINMKHDVFRHISNIIHEHNELRYVYCWTDDIQK